MANGTLLACGLVMLMWAACQPSFSLFGGNAPRPHAEVVTLPVQLYSQGEEGSQRCDLAVRNDADVPVSLEAIRASCSCVVSEFSKTPISPGGEVRFPVYVRWGSASGRKEVNLDVALSDGTSKHYIIIAQRYPLLEFDRGSIIINSVGSGNNFRVVHLLSHSLEKSVASLAEGPKIVVADGGFTVQAIGSAIGQVGAGPVIKRSWIYRVTPDDTVAAPVPAKLVASWGGRTASCHIRYYKQRSVECQPAALFFGEFSARSELAEAEVIARGVSPIGQVKYTGWSGPKEQLEIRQQEISENGDVFLLIRVRTNELPLGPFVYTANLRFIANGEPSTVPVRVSGRLVSILD